jgi:LruC domain-containing protein
MLRYSLLFLLSIVSCFANAQSLNHKYTGSRYVNQLEIDYDWNHRGVPTNIIRDSQEFNVSSDLLSVVNASIPERKPVPSFHPDYIVGDTGSVLEVIDTGDVYVTFVHEGAGYKNVIAYYTYQTGSPPLTLSDLSSIKLLFPNFSLLYSGGGLLPGDTVHLGEFDAGTTIGFVLLANGYNYDTQKFGDGQHGVFSNNILNMEWTEEKRQHFVALWYEEEEKVIMGIEDLNRDSVGCDNDFNDAVFYVSSSPSTGIIKTEVLPETDIVVDSDGDGVSDKFDDYPYDSNKAFDNYIPSEGSTGTYAFEDRWPLQGDYDFNDVVLNYNYKYVTDTSGDIAEITMKFKILATGATYQNGFMVRLNVDASQIASVEGSKLFHNDLTIRNNGTEAGDSDAIIPITDNLNQIHGTFNNVLPNKEYIESAEFEVKVTFSSNITLSPFDVDPFLIINRERGREVHLKGYAPTQSATLSYFNTFDDRSSAFIYYSDINGMPWALDFPSSFDYMKEKKDLSTNYHRFSSWANSSGSADNDWYMPTTENYNTENVYNKESAMNNHGMTSIYTFNFSSKNEVQDTIELRDSQSNLMPLTRVYIYSNDGTYYGSALTNTEGILNLSMSIPSYENSLELRFTSSNGEETQNYDLP